MNTTKRTRFPNRKGINGENPAALTNYVSQRLATRSKPSLPASELYSPWNKAANSTLRLH